MWHAGGMNCARKLIRRRAIRVSAVKPYGVGRLLATTQLAESFVTNLQFTRDVNFAEVQNFTALWADPLSTESRDGWLIEWLELGILVPPEGWENDPVYRRSWVPGGMEEFLQRVGECQWRTAMMRDSLEHPCRMLQLELQPTPKRCLNGKRQATAIIQHRQERAVQEAHAVPIAHIQTHSAWLQRTFYRLPDPLVWTAENLWAGPKQ